MPESPYCTSICICPNENFVVVGFQKPIVRFFTTSGSDQPREDRLHNRYHDECKEKDCPPVATLSFSTDGLALLASTRSLKSGTISFYSWRYPFDSFQEESKCRYNVALHESEDNGVSAAIFRPGSGSEPNLICVTTWTLSGDALLIQAEDGQRTDIKTDRAGHQGQLGSRIQCASFSPSGKALAMVNAKGHLYQILNLNSNPLDVRRIAVSQELKKKEDSFAMSYMSLVDDEDVIVLAWADSSKALGYVKKIPIRSQVSAAYPAA
jgi:WD40 repeat protein